MNAKVKKDNFDKYLEEAKTWETHKVLQAEKSKRNAWIVAGTATVLAFVSVIGISVMGPLKKVEPFVIRVDNSTGIVDVVKTLQSDKTTYDEAMNKFFVQRYIRFREGYNKILAEENYRAVGLMSSATEQKKYYEYFNPKNPDSPINVYGDFAKVTITIKSTSFVQPKVALVRYIKEIERGGEKNVSHWAATVAFDYSKAPMKEVDREINPLDFFVTDYRNDPESTVNIDSVTRLSSPTAAAPATRSVQLYPGQAVPTAQPAQ